VKHRQGGAVFLALLGSCAFALSALQRYAMLQSVRLKLADPRYLSTRSANGMYGPWEV
jgi:hypothetical protein